MTNAVIHKRLVRERGSASDYTCSCGKPALDWAYQYTAGDQELRGEDNLGPYSLNPGDYLPMCRACHRRFDLEHDPVLRERLSQGEAVKKRWETDEEYATKVRSALLGAVRQSSRVRVRCGTCGREMNRGGLGMHQKSTRHEGIELV